jgi:ribosomal protein S18 acetylase RimI-like enzyme
MRVDRNPSEQWLSILADLHRACLPGSIISQLGQGYTRSFYRFAALSDEEAVFAVRDERDVFGGALLTFDPDTLGRRSARATPLLRHLAGSPFGAAARLIVRNAIEGALGQGVVIGLPEVVALFAAPGHRSRGIGAALLLSAEGALRERQHGRYCVRTEDRPDSRAISFYERQGFEAIKRFKSGGESFILMAKSLPGAPSSLEPPASAVVPP